MTIAVKKNNNITVAQHYLIIFGSLCILLLLKVAIMDFFFSRLAHSCSMSFTGLNRLHCKFGMVQEYSAWVCSFVCVIENRDLLLE